MGRNTPIPFGPYLAAAGLIALFWGENDQPDLPAIVLSMAFTVGLTGGIGSGKTTVAELFASRGAGIVDTDEISRRLTAPAQPAVIEIARKFGAAVYRCGWKPRQGRKCAILYSRTPQPEKIWRQSCIH